MTPATSYVCVEAKPVRLTGRHTPSFLVHTPTAPPCQPAWQAKWDKKSRPLTARLQHTLPPSPRLYQKYARGRLATPRTTDCAIYLCFPFHSRPNLHYDDLNMIWKLRRENKCDEGGEEGVYERCVGQWTREGKGSLVQHAWYLPATTPPQNTPPLPPTLPSLTMYL